MSISMLELLHFLTKHLLGKQKFVILCLLILAASQSRCMFLHT